MLCAFTFHSSRLISCHNPLALGIDGVGEDSIAVSVVQTVLSGQLLDVVISVTQVISSSNFRKMSGLVENSSSLILCVAGAGEIREVVEEEITVGDGALGRNGVGQDAVSAVVVGIGAESLRGAGVGRTTLASNLGQNIGDLTTDLVGGVLEEFFDLLSGTRLGSLSGGVGEINTVLLGSNDGIATLALTVALDGSALGDSGVTDGSSSGAIDVSVQLVGVEGDRANELGAVLLGELEDSRGEDVELATRAEVVGVGDIEVNLDGLASGNALEVVLLETVSGDAEADTLESSGLACEFVRRWSWIVDGHLVVMTYR